MKRVLLYIGLSLSFVSLTFAQDLPGVPLIKNYTTDMYNGGIQNWGILQDSRGIIYVANNFGLLQFDGHSWSTNAVSGATKLRSIALGDDGRIYAGLQGDFGYYQPNLNGKYAYHSLKPLLSEKDRQINETWKTYVVSENVYFCTFDKIYRYDGHSIKIISIGVPLDVTYKANNQLYTQVPGIGLHSLQNEAIEPLPYAATFRDKIISGVLKLNDSQLFIGTSRDGFFIADQGTAQPWDTPLNDTFKESFINYFILLKNGTIAVGTQHSGVYIITLEGELLLHLDKDRGLFNRTILSLFEDNNHNLWIGQNNGISFAKLKSPFLLINEQADISGTGYCAFSKNNRLYLGTNNGAYIYSNDEVIKIKGSEGQVYSIQEVGGSLLMGHNNGGYSINENMATHFFDATGVWEYIAFKKSILQGSYNGITQLNAELEVTANMNDFQESSRVLYNEGDSILWMAHGYKGLFRIKPSQNFSRSTFEYYNAENGLPSNEYNNLATIGGVLKFITSDGIYDFDSQRHQFIKDPQLSRYFDGEQIIALKTDVFGNIFFITTEGLGFLEKKTMNGYLKHTDEFNGIRDLLNDDLPNINIINSHLVLFGGKEGFVAFDRNLFWTTEQEIFNTLIRYVTISGEDETVLNAGDRVYHQQVPDVISYANNNISIDFSAPTFSATIPVEYQYKLDGFESSWSQWSTSNFKEYTNLPEGNYTFLVRSKNASGQISEPARYYFTINPPWFRTVLAYIFYTLASVIILFGSILMLNRRHISERERLDARRLKQLSEKEAQLDDITKQTESQINKLKNDKLESEIRHMNTELATNTMHLLNKNEFIDSIKHSLENVEKKSKNQEVKTNIKRIIKEINKNIQTDGDWESFQIHFDKVHGNFSKRIKQEYRELTPQDIKLSAYLRLNLSTKEIANLLRISVRGVEIARYRLRKKLKLQRGQNLTEFILNY